MRIIQELLGNQVNLAFKEVLPHYSTFSDDGANKALSSEQLEEFRQQAIQSNVAYKICCDATLYFDIDCSLHVICRETGRVLLEIDPHVSPVQLLAKDSSEILQAYEKQHETIAQQEESFIRQHLGAYNKELRCLENKLSNKKFERSRASSQLRHDTSRMTKSYDIHTKRVARTRDTTAIIAKKKEIKQAESLVREAQDAAKQVRCGSSRSIINRSRNHLSISGSNSASISMGNSFDFSGDFSALKDTVRGAQAHLAQLKKELYDIENPGFDLVPVRKDIPVLDRAVSALDAWSVSSEISRLNNEIEDLEKQIEKQKRHNLQILKPFYKVKSSLVEISSISIHFSPEDSHAFREYLPPENKRAWERERILYQSLTILGGILGLIAICLIAQEASTIAILTLLDPSMELAVIWTVTFIGGVIDCIVTYTLCNYFSRQENLKIDQELRPLAVQAFNDFKKTVLDYVKPHGPYGDPLPEVGQVPYGGQASAYNNPGVKGNPAPSCPGMPADDDAPPAYTP